MGWFWVVTALDEAVVGVAAYGSKLWTSRLLTLRLCAFAKDADDTTRAESRVIFMAKHRTTIGPICTAPAN
jgi:hypothetical protein